MMMRKRKFAIAFILFAFASFVSGQGNDPGKDLQKDFVLGSVRTIKSSLLNETRTLNIYCPQGYSPDSSKSYPVIFLLDGSADEDFIHIAGLTQFLTMIEAMPKAIVIGVANIDRRRDFTVPTTIENDKKNNPTSGGSSKFLSFVEKELLPFVEKNYKTNGERTLVGQSLGGLLAVQVLVEKPTLFDNYLIVSPSLWWNNETLLDRATAAFPKFGTMKHRIFISVGTEGSQMEADAKKLTMLLESLGNPHLAINFFPMPKETHQTILHRSAYEGLAWLYAPSVLASKK